MPRLTIITACTRYENLPALARSIEPGRGLFAVTWRVVFDGAKVKHRDVPGAVTGVVSHSGSGWGNYQKNFALDNIADGWVYFLDDDNIIHPDFFPAMHRAIYETDASGFAFPQIGGAGAPTKHACPEHMRPDHIDMAQVMMARELIGASRFALGAYNADGRLIEEVYNRVPCAWAFLDKSLCFYNYLRQHVH